MDLALNLTDHAGRRRQGRAVMFSTWPVGPAGEPGAPEDDFRIVILSEPPQTPVAPAEGVVVSVPAQRLASAGAIREATATYSARKQAGLGLSPQDTELLRQGRLLAAAPLQVTPEEVFVKGKARLDLLARDLLLSTAVAEYLSPIADALAAPAPPKAADLERLGELAALVQAVGDVFPADDSPEVSGALSRLTTLASPPDRETFLVAAEQAYPAPRTLMEDIYILRAFGQSPQQAGELLCAQRFLRRAVVPEEEAELALDRSLAMEQLTFVVLAVEPQRLAPARAMLLSFRRKYISAYREHHTRYWAEMARLHARLREEGRLAEALRRLNSLAELGPPAGTGALAAYEELVAQTAGCPLVSGVEEMLAAEALCPACGLTMDQWTPAQRIEEIMERIRRACERQRARLSSRAVQQVLRRSGDPRVEQFLKMVQASQLSSLQDILDDELVGYLRRFLVESRIHEALEPILDQLQTGDSPDVDEARSAMREISGVLQRAFQAAHRALPPGAAPAEDDKPRHQRKR